MKKSQAFLLTIVLSLAFFVLVLWIQSYRLLPSSRLHELLVQKIQALTEGVLKYQNVRVGYFPQPKIIFEQPQLTFSDRPLVVEAEKIQFDFNILPLFLGHAEPAAFYVQSGQAGFFLPGLDILNPVHFDNFSLQVGAVNPKIPIPFHFTSDIAGQPHALVIKGNVVLDSVEQWNWEKASGSMTMELKQLSLDQAAKKFGKEQQKIFFFKGGLVDVSVEIKKKAREAFLELAVTGTGKGIAYEISQEKTWIAPPVLDAECNATAAWNNDTSELKLHKGILKLPFGEIEMNGSMKLNTGEIAGLHVASSHMALEDLLKYWPGLENAIPFHIGFSGPGKWVLSMEGTLDHLTLHFAWDLAQVLLSYGQYFTKPKDIPLDLSFDLLLQKGALLGGDFAVKFKELSMKGNLKDLDLKTGEGQLNLITNKFSMTGWEQYIPILQHYKLDGDAKLMANWKGDLRKLEKAEHIFNITFDKAAWKTPAGFGIQNASFSLDYSPLMLEGRQMQFEVGSSPILVDLKISGFREKPQATAKISSGVFKPLEVWQAFEALFPAKNEEASVAASPTSGAIREVSKVGDDSSEKAPLKSTDSNPSRGIQDHVTDFIRALCPAGNVLENIMAEIHYDGGVWDVPVLQFEGYGGKAALKGKWDFKDKEPEYRLEGELQGVDLGRFLSRQDAAQKVIEGTLNLKGSIEGASWGPEAWHRSLKGQGEWILTGGKFLTFDLKDVLSTIEPLSGLGNIVPTLKNFDSMNFQWRIVEGKAATDNVLVKSKDYVLSGEGTLGFDGLANFRADVFLSSELAAHLLPEIAKPFQKNPQAHLGPIPVLLSGSLVVPEIKPDPAQVGALKEKIREGEAKDILYELVLE